MKGTLLTALASVILAFSLVFCWGECWAAGSAEEPKKILVVYFSHSGNTREVAERIHEKVGGDIFALTVKNPYPADYKKCTEVAKAEQQSNARPQLAEDVPNMASYDVVFVGYPNWWGTLPMALFTFFEKYDFSGKTIIPFCTHGGSRFGRSVQDIAKLSPKATILDGFETSGSRVKNSQNDILAWLGKIGIP
ncbi:flavodoxin [Synergistales bacterium]|nr:flavodoxin [Synergistales bacterium]